MRHSVISGRLFVFVNFYTLTVDFVERYDSVAFVAVLRGGRLSVACQDEVPIHRSRTAVPRLVVVVILNRARVNNDIFASVG